jgi:geranylgeranyl diphosphate synthase type II
MNKKFIEKMKEDQNLVEKKLEILIKTENFDSPERLINAMNYSLLAGGKRVRPLLILKTYRCFKGDISSVMPLALAMEMIHTYSLIHDDLPGIDNDDMRRNKPTNHVAYDEATAIFAGDALLNYAFEYMLDHIPTESSEFSEKYLKAVKEIINASGANGMLGGQMADIQGENRDINLEELQYIHRHKTGALINASILSGAYMAECDERTINTWKTYGTALGMAFQIKDDLLDVESSTEELGKPVGSDEKNKKTTYISLLGIEKTRMHLQEQKQKALKALGSIDADTEFLELLTEYVCERKK